MDTDFADLALMGAGIMMLSHLFLSMLLRALVGWHSPLAAELFSLPNAPLVPDWGFRLLNAKFFLPWVPSPQSMQSQPTLARISLLLARISGGSVPILLLAFMALSILLGNVYGYG
jgi:hypothetical protein